MMTSLFHRSKFALRLASLLPGRGLTSTLLHADGSTSENKSGVRKLDYDGKPADGTQMITPLIVHKGLNYVSGQGANDAGSAQRGDIESHTTKVMNNVKKLVEGGGSMDSILQLTGHLADLDYYDGRNRVFRTHFPHGGPRAYNRFRCRRSRTLAARNQLYIAAITRN